MNKSLYHLINSPIQLKTNHQLTGQLVVDTGNTDSQEKVLCLTYINSQDCINFQDQPSRNCNRDLFYISRITSIKNLLKAGFAIYIDEEPVDQKLLHFQNQSTKLQKQSQQLHDLINHLNQTAIGNHAKTKINHHGITITKDKLTITLKVNQTQHTCRMTTNMHQFDNPIDDLLIELSARTARKIIQDLRK